jgi:eukaryotic-like serine/threonine-protein kinase
MEPSAPSRFGPYEIVAIMGAGGMGEVYCARDPRLRRDVALKILHATALDSAGRRQRFVEEAQAAGAPPISVPLCKLA